MSLNGICNNTCTKSHFLYAFINFVIKHYKLQAHFNMQIIFVSILTDFRLSEYLVLQNMEIVKLFAKEDLWLSRKQTCSNFSNYFCNRIEGNQRSSHCCEHIILTFFPD